jgi:hypothetical protein
MDLWKDKWRRSGNDDEEYAGKYLREEGYKIELLNLGFDFTMPFGKARLPTLNGIVFYGILDFFPFYNY